MPVSDGFRAFVEDQLGRSMPIRSRRMFGGLGLYSEDLFFGVVADDLLYLKVDDGTRPRYQAAGTRPFNPMGSEMNGYWLVPGEVVEDAEALGEWAMEAVEVARRAKRPKRPKREGGN